MSSMLGLNHSRRLASTARSLPFKCRSQPSVFQAMKTFQSPTCDEKVVFRNMGVMQYLQTEARQEVDPRGERWALFARESPKKINTGSLIQVTYQTSLSTQTSLTFIGVLLAVRRSTATPTIHVRGIIDGVGVEQVFCIFSPLLHSIKVLKTLPYRTDKKFYYLRERPHEISRLQAHVSLGEDGERDKKKSK